MHLSLSLLQSQSKKTVTDANKTHPDSKTEEGDDIYAVCINVPSMSHPVLATKILYHRPSIRLSIVVDVVFAAGTE